MIPSLRFILELHLNQVLVVVCGYLLSKRIFRSSKAHRMPSFGVGRERAEPPDLASVYVLGFLWFAIIGALALVSPVPTRTIVGATGVLIVALSFRSGITLEDVWEGYRRLCLYPLLIFLIPATFLLTHFTGSEIAKGIDPWLLIDRTLSYRVPDHYLQWTISENFYKNLPIETNFNPKGKSMWSAGDRPVLIGLLNATFSQISNTSSITMYYLRIIFISVLVLPVLNSILKDEFRIQRRFVRYVCLITMALSPFFLINTIFTWPKMAGLSFGMMGFALFMRSVRTERAGYACVAGIGVALGLISHTAAMFCLVAIMLYALGAWTVTYRHRIPLGRLVVLAVTLLAPIVVITQTHGRLLSRVTNQTHLLPRVQLCRGGSYAVITPVESVFESCKKYYQRQGLAGVIADRRESIRRAFEFAPFTYGSATLAAFLNPTTAGEYLRSLNTPFLLNVPTSIGHVTPLLAGLLAVAYLVSLGRFKILPFSLSSLLLPIGLLLLFAFSCMLGEYTEMSSHVVPFVAPVFIQLGIMIELHRLWRPAFYGYCVVSLTVSLAVLLARAQLL